LLWASFLQSGAKGCFVVWYIVCAAVFTGGGRTLVTVRCNHGSLMFVTDQPMSHMV